MTGRMFDFGNDPEKQSLHRQVWDSTFRVSLRLAGAVNDLRQMAALPPLPLERVQAPALVIHGDRDSLVPFALRKQAAETIPGAQLFVLQAGNLLHFIQQLPPGNPAGVQVARMYDA